MNGELLRIVDGIRREKKIDAEIVFQGIELALASAARKHFGEEEDVRVTIDRESGNIIATLDGLPMDPEDLGRIAAQTAKQVMIQKIREAERASLMDDYADQVGTIVSGQVTRVERGNAVVNLGRGEGFLPRSEQIPGETLHVADRIRAMILDVRESGASVKIVLSRTHPDLIARLFDLEVPEVADRVITLEGIAREPGHRTKVAVSSIDSRVDAVGACVGIRGSRIKNIVEEVAGEKIDIVRFNESPQVYIGNALKPAEVKEILLNRDIGRASVLVADDQLSLAIGKKGQNVRLAARLTGWSLDIMTPAEYDSQRFAAEEQLAGLPACGPELAAEIVAAGYISLADVCDAPRETLMQLTGLEADEVEQLVSQTSTLLAELEVKAAAEQAAAAKRAEAEAAAAKEAEGEEAEEAALTESDESPEAAPEGEPEGETIPEDQADAVAPPDPAATPEIPDETRLQADAPEGRAVTERAAPPEAPAPEAPAADPADAGLPEAAPTESALGPMDVPTDEPPEATQPAAATAPEPPTEPPATGEGAPGAPAQADPEAEAELDVEPEPPAAPPRR